MTDRSRDLITLHDGWEPKCHDEAQKQDRVATLRLMRRPAGQRVPKPALAQEMETLKALVVAQERELRELRTSLTPSTGSRLDAFLDQLGVVEDADSRPRNLSPGLLEAMSAGDDGE